MYTFLSKCNEVSLVYPLYTLSFCQLTQQSNAIVFTVSLSLSLSPCVLHRSLESCGRKSRRFRSSSSPFYCASSCI